jgi:thiol-disulfide isomerase/thioredoxin
MLTKHVHELDNATFQDSINQGARPVLVDFWAPWCPPCRTLAPTIEAIAEQFDGRADVAKLDIDQNPETAAARLRNPAMSKPSKRSAPAAGHHTRAGAEPGHGAPGGSIAW